MQPLGNKLPVMEITQFFGSSAHTTWKRKSFTLWDVKANGRFKTKLCFLTQNVKLWDSPWEEAMDDESLHGFKKVTAQIGGRKFH